MAREPERVVSLARWRVNACVEVVGHGADVLVADVVAQRLQEQDVAVRCTVIRRRVDPRRVEREELAAGPSSRLSADGEGAFVGYNQPQVGRKRQEAPVAVL